MNPARNAREKAQQIWPGATVVERTSGSIRHRHPTQLNKFMVDAQAGQIFHLDDLSEVDTAWEVSADPAWQWQMIKSVYHTYARNVLNAGDTIKYVHPASGENVIFQPLALNWVDDVTNSRQQITQPQAISATPVDDLLRWENGYGTGRHFSWRSDTGKLEKVITIDALANLPAPTVSNPYLEIEFIIKRSAGVRLYVDGVLWDDSTRTVTANSIEYRRTADGTTLWYLAKPGALDANDNWVDGKFELRRQGNNRYCTVRIPKTWIDTAVFPIRLDPTVDAQIGATANDGWVAGTSFFNNTNNIGLGNSGGQGVKMFARFTGITISGTIDVAYVTLEPAATDSDTINLKLLADDQDNPTAITSASDYNGRAKTTAQVDWDPSGWTAQVDVNSASITTVIQELVDTYTISADAIQIFIIDDGSGTNLNRNVRDYTNSAAQSAQIHIEYTEGGAATSFVIPRKSKTYLRR